LFESTILKLATVIAAGVDRPVSSMTWYFFDRPADSYSLKRVRLSGAPLRNSSIPLPGKVIALSGLPSIIPDSVIHLSKQLLEAAQRESARSFNDVARGSNLWTWHELITEETKLRPESLHIATSVARRLSAQDERPLAIQPERWDSIKCNDSLDRVVLGPAHSETQHDGGRSLPNSSQGIPAALQPEARSGLGNSF
jgi:hypothetical protein